MRFKYNIFLTENIMLDEDLDMDLEEIMDISWIKEFKEAEKDYEDLYCENVKSINVKYIYVNKDNEIKKYNQEEYILKEDNVLSEQELINIIKKSQESKKYKMSSILKYNLHVDPKEIVENKLINYEKFLTEVKEIKDVIFEDTIKCYQNMNIIYIIYSEIEKKNRKKTEKYKLKLNNKKSRKYS